MCTVKALQESMMYRDSNSNKDGVLMKLQIWSRFAKIIINLLQPKMYYTHNINLTLEKTIKVTSNPYETWNKQYLIYVI